MGLTTNMIKEWLGLGNAFGQSDEPQKYSKTTILQKKVTTYGWATALVRDRHIRFFLNTLEITLNGVVLL